jgi:hypothetical protein
MSSGGASRQKTLVRQQIYRVFGIAGAESAPEQQASENPYIYSQIKRFAGRKTGSAFLTII